MPENESYSVEQKNQFREIYSWQREMALAEEALEDIARDLRQQQLNGAPDWVDTEIDELLEAEKQRYRYLRGLQSLPPEQHRRAHNHIKAQHRDLVQSIFALKTTLEEPIPVEPPDFI
ncbi:MAG: hypothetical protein ACWA5X_05580 [bacterium]